MNPVGKSLKSFFTWCLRLFFCLVGGLPGAGLHKPHHSRNANAAESARVFCCINAVGGSKVDNLDAGMEVT